MLQIFVAHELNYNKIIDDNYIFAHFATISILIMSKG